MLMEEVADRVEKDMVISFEIVNNLDYNARFELISKCVDYE